MKNTLRKLFNGNSLTKENDFNFCNWYCKNSALENKAKILTKKVEFLAKELEFDLDKFEVDYGNNYFQFHKLYDSFWITNIDNSRYFICVIPCICDAENKTIIFVAGKNGNFEMKFPNWRTFKKLLKEDLELKEELAISIK